MMAKTYEIWKEIKGYENQYCVSNLGNVKSLHFAGKKDNPKNLSLGNILGYKGCVLTAVDGKRTNYLVHRLVADAFLSDDIKGKEVNHRDENKANNCVANLEIVTHKQNVNAGTSIIRSALARQKEVYQYDTEGNHLAIYDSITSATKMTGVCMTSISLACRGKLKTAGGYIWKFSGKKGKTLPKLYEQLGD